MASNSIFSLSGFEARLAKVDSILTAIVPTVVADVPTAVSDVATIAGAAVGAVASPVSAVAAVGPVSAAFMGLLHMVESLVSGIEAATPGSSVPASVGTLTGAEAAGPNKA